MPITTRLTRRLGIRHPVLSAPMAFAAGGRLASAVTNAGGFGFIGGGYGDGAWLDVQFREAGNTSVGCGFITWSMAKAPHLLDLALEKKPKALFLSFADPTPYVAKIRAAGALAIQQLQTIRDAEVAIDAGVDIIVAQGAEAGGHGERRATMTLVPEVADLLAKRAPHILLCAAGGIADGRGLAAALVLGADGAVVGSRFWAASEALVHPAMHASAVGANGDETVRQGVTDAARGYDWPDRFDIRTLRTPYIERWLGREAALSQSNADRECYAKAVSDGDVSIAPAIAGEAIGLIHSIEPAGVILERMVDDAERLLGGGWRR